ncbi:AlkZ family DNA glycosylase [Saccharothrix sp. 6-C]|uniref:winged helix DNA-binding domain-containing protein n=1 Tax=Saccharothrix sp. 6-C TaxID=2781735 RepID=UPI0019173D50|nr:winged helix DNA-binding domain-containing protein [Saccharothrix sp. 6-C]QQQ79724.1 AlkZ family DNA glycosylase [Saccharothrix sp. 6-C]
MRAQRLTTPARSLPELLRDVLAVQAQDTAAAGLAVRARTTGVTPADLRAALAAGDVVRTCAMRGAVHLLRREDVGWLVGLLGPVNAARSRRRRLELGLTDDVCARALDALREVLTEPLTRPQVVARLADVGVVLDPASPAPAYLLAHAANKGLVGAGESTYRLLPRAEDDEPRGVAELVRRYLRAYGPATVEDFTAWSGLPEAEVGAAFPFDELVRGGHGWQLPATDAADLDGTVRLLGPFDTFLLGYSDRTLLLDPLHAPLVRTVGPHVVVDGQVRGTWRRRDGRVVVEQFGHIPVSELDVEVESVLAWA